MSLLRKLIAMYAWRTGRARGLYVRLSRPSSLEWAGFLRRWGGFQGIGENTSINIDCVVTDPAYTRIGRHVILADCVILGHDASISVLNHQFDASLDSVGPVVVNDNCFIGHGAILMPRVEVGPNSIVAAGAVVTRRVPPGVVVGGNPARVICTTREMLERTQSRCETYPWMDLIRSRTGAFDADMEPLLVQRRARHFFPE